MKADFEREPTQIQVEQQLNTIHQEISLACLQCESTLALRQANVNAIGANLSGYRKSCAAGQKRSRNCPVRGKFKEQRTHRKYSENLGTRCIDHELEMKNISNLNVLQQPT